MRLPICSAVLSFATLVLSPALARAHCDGMDGPVVGAARAALEAREVKLVLPWVRAADEREVVAAFRQTLEARKAGGVARQVADRWFFETLVRVHRAGEGEPFTGLKPAGTDPGAAVRAADEALATGSPDVLIAFLTSEVRETALARFREAKALSGAQRADVAARRRYVEAYVRYVHEVERIHRAASAQHVAAEAHAEAE
jgi:hypothetical protein